MSIALAVNGLMNSDQAMNATELTALVMKTAENLKKKFARSCSLRGTIVSRQNTIVYYGLYNSSVDQPLIRPCNPSPQKRCLCAHLTRDARTAVYIGGVSVTSRSNGPIRDSSLLSCRPVNLWSCYFG